MAVVLADGRRASVEYATLDVHDFTLVGHSLGGAVATGLAERLRDDVSALVLMAPAGFGRIRVAEAIGLPMLRSVVRHGLPLALLNPVTALGVYMAVVGNGHLPDPELVARAAQERLPLGAGRPVRERGDHGVRALAPRVLPPPARLPRA